MQDPWHSEYYRDKPKEQRPPKYWLSYRMNKYLEPIAMKTVDGLISVSENYITDLKNRYPQIKNISAANITFGAFKADIETVERNEFPNLLNPAYKNIVYIGRGGMDMHSALTPIFNAFKKGLSANPDYYKTIRLHFIGTSYAPAGRGELTLMPLAEKLGIEYYVTELPGRISYYQSLATLNKADALLLTGSDDPNYTASKIYPYLLLKKPVLSIFNAQSPALRVLKEYRSAYSYGYNQTPNLEDKIAEFFESLIGNEAVEYDLQAEGKYSAETLTAKQCALFNMVYKNWHKGPLK